METWLLILIICAGGGLVLFGGGIVLAVMYFVLRRRRGYEVLDSESKAPRSPIQSDDRIPHGQKPPRDINDYLVRNVKAPTEDEAQKQRREEALINARLYLRSSTCVLDKQIPNIGSRKYKSYFLVKHPKEGTQMLSIVARSEHCEIPIDVDSGKATFTNLLLNIKHPYIFPTVETEYLQEHEQIVILRPYCPKGSLKDFIHKSSVQNPYVRKYSQAGKKLKPSQIAIFGRQILEGLSFLRSKGFVYGHLNTANIMLHNNVCRISEYENGLLNLVPKLQKFFIALRERDADVIAFGHVLYEMAIGYEIQDIDALYIPPACPKLIKTILIGIFSDDSDSHADKLSIRKVDDLLDLQFFADVPLREPNTKKTRIETRGKDMLKLASKSSIVGNPDVTREGRPTSKCTSRNTLRGSSSRSKRRIAGGSGKSSKGTSASSVGMSAPVASPPPIATPPPAVKSVAVESQGESSGGTLGSPRQEDRGALLSSISGFNKSGLSKTVTNDKSSPLISRVKD